MIRRLTLTRPGASPEDGHERPVRLLAVSDDRERALDFESNRSAMAPLDAVIGCGDLEPDYLAFLADAFRVPLLYVRGNHDRGANWQAGRARLPQPLGTPGEQVMGLDLVGLSWPGDAAGRAVRDDFGAWRQALKLAIRAPRIKRPLIMISHVPPRGLGDTPEDAYHRGFAAYHWLCRRLQPMLWLHGHTAPAAGQEWRVSWGSTTLVNVTGAVLVEIGPSALTTANIVPLVSTDAVEGG